MSLRYKRESFENFAVLQLLKVKQLF